MLWYNRVMEIRKNCKDAEGYGCCCLCGKPLGDPLLTAHRCKPIKNKYPKNRMSPSAKRQADYSERLEDGFFMRTLAELDPDDTSFGVAVHGS